MILGLAWPVESTTLVHCGGGVTCHVFSCAVELLRVGQWFKRLPNDFPIQFEVWEVFVMPHMVTRDYKPPATTA